MPDAPERPTREELEAQSTPAAQRVLAALDAAAAALPDGLDPSHAQTLVTGALLRGSPALVRPRSPRLAFAAGVLVAAAASAAFLRLAGSPSVAAVTGEVTLDGRRLHVADGARRFGGQAMLRTGAAGSAVVFASKGTVLVPRSSALEGDLLLEGALLAEGAGLELRAGEDTVTIDGKVWLSMEPGAQLPRVTPSEETMRKAWMMAGPAAAGAVVGAVLTVFVVEGRATVSAAHALPVTVSAGEQWNAKERKPVAVAAASAAATDPVVAADVTAGLSREQLIARVEVLRNEKEELLRERAVLRKSLEDRHEKGASGREDDGDGRRVRNYFQLTPEELKASAAKGELRLRVALGEEVPKIEPKAADAVGLTPAERKAIEALYAARKPRLETGLRGLYREMGGSEPTSYELSEEALLQELRSQAVKGDFANAIRQLANERAGLVPRMRAGEGPAVLRAFRLVLEEDERFVADVSALLGPARAEAFLNHPNTPHSDNVFGVGPAPAK